MSLSNDSTIDNITADDQIELSNAIRERHSGFDNCTDQSRGTADQQQLKLLHERMAKMELEFENRALQAELGEQRLLTTVKELENKLLQAEMREHKLLAERNALQAKVDKQEQEQQQQQKEDNNKEENVSFDQFTAILARIGELEKEQKQQNEQQGKANQISCQQQNDQQKTGDLAQLKTSYDARFVNIDERVSILLPNLWNDPACHDDLAIITGRDFGIFYTEMKVRNEKGWFALGLATEAMPSERSVGCSSDSYGYHNDGFVWINGSKMEEIKPTFSAGDVIGCGVILATRQIIFTKNGRRLDTTDLPAVSSPIDSLFPCFSLPFTRKIEANKCEANLGPCFKFSLAQVQELTELPQNWWDATACHSHLEIIAPKCSIINGKGGGSVFAKHPIRRINAPIFYFEMKVEKVKRWVAIGLATKAMPLNRWVGCYKDSYGYRSDGKFRIDGSKKEGNPTFSAGDVVGCGVNLANCQIIFTKNGQRLDYADLCVPVPFIDSLFPCVTLGNSGDKIVANFGPDFKFDVGTLH